MNLSTVKKLMREFPFARPIIEEIFPIKGDKLSRNSSVWFDYMFGQFLCIYLGYDGYYSSAIGGLHPEVMICRPAESLENPQLYVWFAETVKRWIDGMEIAPDKKMRVKTDQDAQIFLNLYIENVKL